MRWRERRTGFFPVLAALTIFMASLLPAHAAGPDRGRDLLDNARSILGLVAESVEQTIDPSVYFSETGFGIDEPRFAQYFARRGGIRTFGFPTSRTFLLLGLRSQFFQRGVLQLGPDGGVRTLNLLDPGLMPYTRINGSTFPAPDPQLAAAAPAPGGPNYGPSVVEFVRRNAPETFNGQPVRFFTTFSTSVSLADAFPNGGGNPDLLPLLNLEIWGVPTSAPAQDPSNGNFIYQRFQRGIMHYDAGCRCTQGLLLADYFKALITGEGLPPDLDEQARTSIFRRQLRADSLDGLSRPDLLPATDLREAFVRQPAPPVSVVAAPAVSAPAVSAPPARSGPFRTRIRVDQALVSSIDALEEVGRPQLLEAIIESDTEIRFETNDELPENVHALYRRETGGTSRGPLRSIVVNKKWRASDSRALATAIAHEAKHLADDLAGADPRRSPESCFQFEIRAFVEQSLVWEGFYGPNGKAQPRDDLDRELNAWLSVYRRDPAELERRVRQSYAEACTRPARTQEPASRGQ